MGIPNPYYRIIRPFTNGEYFPVYGTGKYVLDEKYALDRSILIRSYDIIEKDLITLFNYIEPHDNNLNVFSHKTYELLLRASTEFETNCKEILYANDYKKNKDDLKIKDYYKIEHASKLSEYKVILNVWSPNVKTFQPFIDWANNQYSPLTWYQAYNKVKHSRSREFLQASLENVMLAVTGLFAILFSQFSECLFFPYQNPEGCCFDDIDNAILYSETSLFQIKPPTNWGPDEQYDFNWNEIKKSNDPYRKFSFK